VSVTPLNTIETKLSWSPNLTCAAAFPVFVL